MSYFLVLEGLVMEGCWGWVLKVGDEGGCWRWLLRVTA